MRSVILFFRLTAIEWKRLSRHVLFWLTLAAAFGYICLSSINFYRTNLAKLLDGTLSMPGLSFDIANALDQLVLILPLLVIAAAFLMGGDYSQRTNQHWLMHSSRAVSLLAKLAALVGLALLVHLSGGLAGVLTGIYFKQFVLHAFSLENVNWLAALAAPFYMTLVSLPYITLSLLITVLVRSSFFSIALGLGYTLVLDNLLSGFLFGTPVAKWLFNNVYFSASFLLNQVGYRFEAAPGRLLGSLPALGVAGGYALVLVLAAVLFYRRQDLGS